MKGRVKDGGGGGGGEMMVSVSCSTNGLEETPGDEESRVKDEEERDLHYAIYGDRWWKMRGSSKEEEEEERNERDHRGNNEQTQICGQYRNDDHVTTILPHPNPQLAAHQHAQEKREGDETEVHDQHTPQIQPEQKEETDATPDSLNYPTSESSLCWFDLIVEVECGQYHVLRELKDQLDQVNALCRSASGQTSFLVPVPVSVSMSGTECRTTTGSGDGSRSSTKQQQQQQEAPVVRYVARTQAMPHRHDGVCCQSYYSHHMNNSNDDGEHDGMGGLLCSALVTFFFLTVSVVAVVCVVLMLVDTKEDDGHIQQETNTG